MDWIIVQPVKKQHENAKQNTVILKRDTKLMDIMRAHK